MKTLTQISSETKKAIQVYLNLSEKFKNSYFWSAPSSANQRRKMESDNTFNYEGDGIQLSFSLDVSCKNIYVRKSILIDGKIKTIVSLKKILQD